MDSFPRSHEENEKTSVVADIEEHSGFKDINPGNLQNDQSQIEYLKVSGGNIHGLGTREIGTTSSSARRADDMQSEYRVLDNADNVSGPSVAEKAKRSEWETAGIAFMRSGSESDRLQPRNIDPVSDATLTEQPARGNWSGDLLEDPSQTKQGFHHDGRMFPGRPGEPNTTHQFIKTGSIAGEVGAPASALNDPDTGGWRSIKLPSIRSTTGIVGGSHDPKRVHPDSSQIQGDAGSKLLTSLINHSGNAGTSNRLGGDEEGDHELIQDGGIPRYWSDDGSVEFMRRDLEHIKEIEISEDGKRKSLYHYDHSLKVTTQCGIASDAEGQLDSSNTMELTRNTTAVHKDNRDCPKASWN
jgi:hypothetical protein